MLRRFCDMLRIHALASEFQAVGSSGKKSRIVPIGLLDDIPDASDDDEGADNATHNSKVGQKASSLKEKSAHSADSDERSDSSEASAEEDADERAEQTAAVVKDGASVNYDAIVEAQAQSRLQREVAAANAEELEKVTQARRARDKAALTGALEEFYDKYVTCLPARCCLHLHTCRHHVIIMECKSSRNSITLGV